MHGGMHDRDQQLNQRRETQQYLRKLRLKLALVENWSKSAKKHDTMYRLSQRIWVVEGMLTHGFKEKHLNAVVKDLEKLDALPKGYLYP